MAGNTRFLTNAQYHGVSKEALADLAKAQHPFATILSCSDSRVPPELVFDAKFGELFVIRVAGNVVSPGVLGSLQYAGSHLQTKLFMVLGHEGCGAVEAALAAKFHGARERSRIQLLLQSMLPGLDAIDPHLSPAEMLARAVEANVRWSMRQLLDTPEGAHIADTGAKLVGAVCATS
jgi:carbonic anhydrase